MTKTEQLNRLGFLSKIMREEAQLVTNPAHRDRMLNNARSLSWTYRNLGSLKPDVVDALIEGSIEVIVYFASARVPWQVTS